jgi:hypothetical protein
LKRFLKIYVRRKAFVAVSNCSRWKGQPGLLMAKRPAFLKQKEFIYITHYKTGSYCTRTAAGKKGQPGLLVGTALLPQNALVNR